VAATANAEVKKNDKKKGGWDFSFWNEKQFRVESLEFRAGYRSMKILPLNCIGAAVMMQRRLFYSVTEPPLQCHSAAVMM
jgi:hypothetical protein